MNNYYLFISLLLAFLWGVSPIIHKRLLKKYDSMSMLFFSATIYFLCLLCVIPFHYKTLKGDIEKITNMEVVEIFLAAALTGFSANYLYYYALKSNSSSIVAALGSTSPLFTLLLAFLFLREKLSLISIVGVIFIVIGVACISVNDSSLNEYFANRE